MTGGATPAVLAVDAGSSRVRASLVAVVDGSVLATESAPTRASGHELDVDEAWADLAGLVGALDAAGADVRGVAVAAQLSTVLLDDRGRPVRPAMLWGDTRAAQEAERVTAALPAQWPAISGRRPAPELAVAKARWVAEHEPRAFARARRLTSLKDALVQRMTREAVVTDPTHASYTGLFDVASRRWAAELSGSAGVDAKLLPPVAEACAVAGPLAPETARELGLEAGIPVAVGGPDGTVGAVGAGAVRPGVTVDVAGTTDVLVHVTARPPTGASAHVVVNAHAAPALWTVGGPTGLTGGAVEWTARLLRFASAAEAYAQLGDAAPSSPARAGGPVFLTALGGSRFPTWRSEERGAVVGLRPEHGPLDVFRAAQEGAAFTVAEGLVALRELGASPREVVVVGGAAGRPATLQLRADAWNLPVVALANREATTIGAAMLAAVAAGAFPDLDAAARALVRPAARYEPRPGEVERLAAARVRWRDIGSELFGS